MSRALLTLALVAGCGGREAVQVDLPVVTDANRVTPVETNLGYSVTVVSARAAVRDIEFTIEGEEHATGTMGWIWDSLVPPAYAHPGHSAGGEVTGELRGEFVVDFTTDGAPVGTATLLAVPYEGANFTFRRAGDADGLAPDDPLLAHTLYIEASIARGAQTWTATMALDLDDGTRLIGAPFEHEVAEDATETIRLQLTTADPFEDDTAFDGLDFAALDDDDDGIIAIEPGQTAHNQLRRLLGAHDYYFVQAY